MKIFKIVMNTFTLLLAILPIAAGGLVYSLKNSEDKKQTLIKAGKGSLVSGSAIMVSGIVGDL